MASVEKIISEIKPIKEKLSKTMKNIDVLYANSSLEGFVKQLQDRKLGKLNKNQPTSDNKVNKFHELRALDRYLNKLTSNKPSNALAKSLNPIKNKNKPSNTDGKERTNNSTGNKLFQHFENNSRENIKKKIKKILEKRKDFLNENPEPGRYSPNYNSIYKNIHGVVLKKPLKGPSKNSLYANFQEDSKKLKTTTATGGFMLTALHVGAGNESPKSKSKSPKSSRSSSRDKHNFIEGLSPLDARTRFYQTSKLENYSKRKFIIDENKVSKINTYVEPFNYSEVIKKNAKKKAPFNIPSISMRRVPGRTHEGLINDNNYPTPLTYHPKFSAVQAKVKSFTKYDRVSGQDIKKYLLRKVWYSYNQSVDMRVAKLKNFVDTEKMKNKNKFFAD